MQNLAEAGEWKDERLDAVYDHLRTMQASLSAEDYFRVLEGMIERARDTIQAMEDPLAQADLTQFYCRVIDYAVKLSLAEPERCSAYR